MCDEKLHIFYHAVGASFLFYAAMCRRDGGVGGGVVEGSQTKKPAHRFAGDWTLKTEVQRGTLNKLNAIIDKSRNPVSIYLSYLSVSVLHQFWPQRKKAPKKLWMTFYLALLAFTSTIAFSCGSDRD